MSSFRHTSLLITAFVHQYILISFILVNLEIKRMKSKLLMGTISLFFIFFFIADLFYGTLYSASAANFSIILLCFYYYYSLLNNNLSILVLKENASFIIITGIFISTSLIFPILLLGDVLYNTLSQSNFYLIAIIAPLASVILYSFFLFGLICFIRKK